MLLLFHTLLEFNKMSKVSSHRWIEEVAVDSKTFCREKLSSERRLTRIKAQLVIQTN